MGWYQKYCYNIEIVELCRPVLVTDAARVTLFSQVADRATLHPHASSRISRWLCPCLSVFQALLIALRLLKPWIECYKLPGIGKA